MSTCGMESDKYKHPKQMLVLVCLGQAISIHCFETS